MISVVALGGRGDGKSPEYLTGLIYSRHLDMTLSKNGHLEPQRGNQ